MRGEWGTIAVVDILRWPVLGPFLRWRHARTSLQLVLLAVAAVVVAHGLFGPDFAPANFATVGTWVHYRGLLVVALLAAGNLFCTGCPMIRVRDWGRRVHAPSWHWPAWLRGKWMAVVLVAAVLFSYELFDLWSLPRATAWLVLAYFGTALIVDMTFTGATFCKHLCPVGQFNFVAFTMSPLEVRVRNTDVCGACRTEDCIAGRRVTSLEPLIQRGCELGLFLPKKVGNLDCTLCLDCVQACPHDNVALATRTPGAEWLDSSRRSAIGRIGDRPDLAALVVVFVFGAMLNAFAMVGPVRTLEMWIGASLGLTSDAAVLAVLFACGLVLVPMVTLGLAGAATRALVGREAGSLRQVVMRQVYSLVPFGFGAWLAHYGFHLLTGALVFIPVLQSAAIDASGHAWLGQPLWRWVGMRPGAVLPVQLGFLALGTLGSLTTVILSAERDHPSRVWRAATAWLVLVLLLAAATAWILWQPMDMRGTGGGA